MKIIYFANSNLNGYEAGREERMKREKRLRELVGPDVDISIVDNPQGPLSLETAKDEIQALPGTAQNLISAQEAGVDAGVLGCAVDPGYHILRELVTFPLIGPGHTAIFTAAMLGNRFSIYTPLESTVASTRKLVEDTGLAAQLGSIRPVNLQVLEIRAHPEATMERLIDIGKRMIAEDNADTLIFGCMSMAFQNIAGELSRRLGVSVVDPVAVSVTLAESMARIGLSHSPRFYHRKSI